MQSFTSNERNYPLRPGGCWYTTPVPRVSWNDGGSQIGNYPQTTTPNFHFTSHPLQQLQPQIMTQQIYRPQNYRGYHFGYPGSNGSHESYMEIPAHNIILTKSKRLSLIPLSLEHIPGLFKVYNDEMVTHFVPINRHHKWWETENLIKYYLMLVNMQNALVFTIWNHEDHSIIGNAGIYEIDKDNKKGSLGAVIHSKYWNKGYVTEACQKLLEIGFKELKLIRIEGSCAEENSASEKLMKKIGMTYEGTLRSNLVIKGESTNIKVYSILQKEFYPLEQRRL